MKGIIALTTIVLSIASCALADEPVALKLWPNGAPEPVGFKPEVETQVTGGSNMRIIKNVSEPTITLYRPERPNGTAVIVAPGGGYSYVAIEHEGTRICEEMNAFGVTCVLLKYRVPRRGRELGREQLQDAQRAMGIVRHHAAEWGIRPDRVGMIGFSAGGYLTVMMTLHANERTYTPDPALDVDDATPSFSIPVYPAYLVAAEDTFKLNPAIAVTDKAPPICLIHGGEDQKDTSSSGSALLYLEYKKRNLPAELHILAKGGHGVAWEVWLPHVKEWMKSMGWLTP